MYLNQNSIQYKHYQDFQKFAQFVCSKFDIEVQLESTRAETDGKTIFLPNVMSMTTKELDMMYAILLHEAGHIRYSTFDDNYFKRLKTKAHAFLANCIEDARIENLLMIDFAGATDMFQSLYTDYTQDKFLMKKVFKHDGSKPDLFAALAFHTHNSLINCKTSSLKEICGVRVSGLINKFWKQNNLAHVLNTVSLKNDDDVIALTNLIYDLFINQFAQKDKSTKIDYARDTAEKNEIQTVLNNLHSEGQKVEAQVDNLRKKINEIYQKIETFEKDNAKNFEDLEAKQNALENQKETLDKKIQWKKEYDTNSIQAAAMPNEITTTQKNIEQKIAEKTLLEQMLESGVNGRNKEMSPEQIEKTKTKIETKKTQIEKANQKLNNQTQQLANLEQDLLKAEAQAKNYPDSFDKNLDLDIVGQEIKDIKAKTESVKDELTELDSQKNKMFKDANNIQEQMNKAQVDFMEKAAQVMVELDKKGSNSEIDLGILPEINYKDSWPEAAEVQEKFDADATKKIGKMVRNGQKGAGLFGSNIRDIITFIDKKKELVEEIDVAEIFKGKIGTSKLEDFNSDTKNSNSMEDKSIVGVFGTRREHIPLTTMFDCVKKENTSTNTQEFKELMIENSSFYRDLKRVFARRFKFSRKDFWRGGQEDGQFDNRNLWKLPTNQGDDFYEKNTPKFENKVAATILVDISGSQNKEVTEYGKHIRSLALGLSQALNEVHIKHEIIGYHAPISEEMRQMDCAAIYTRRSNKLETIIYKDVAQKDCIGIMNIEPQMTDNSDGESLRIALKRLKAIRAKSHMIFIISDGKPFLCDTDMSVLDEDFRDSLRQAVRDKVQVFGLGFFNQLEHFLGERFCNSSKNQDVVRFFDQAKF